MAAFLIPVVTSSRRSGSRAQQVAGERRPLPHGDHHVVSREPLDDFVLVVHVVGERLHRNVIAERGPIGGSNGNALIVVENGDP